MEKNTRIDTKTLSRILNMKKIKTFIGYMLYVIILLLSIDLIFGYQILRIISNETSDYHRIRDKNYHHSLLPLVRVEDRWGDNYYNVCTDNNGFRISCIVKEKKLEEVSGQIIIIGDSFTEGVGVEYEDTFAGHIDSYMNQYNVINLGVSSYSPSVYYSKILKHSSEFKRLKKVYVFIDISDIQDEAQFYSLSSDGVVYDKGRDVNEYNFKRGLFNLFPVMYSVLDRVKVKILSSDKKKMPFKEKYNIRSAWTWMDGFEYGGLGVKGGIDQATQSMEKLSMLLKSKDVELNVIVYPWPDQVKYGIANSKQVQIWKNFCKERCKNFIDTFPEFFRLKQDFGIDYVLNKYYLPGDVHFSKDGHGLISSIVLNKIVE